MLRRITFLATFGVLFGLAGPSAHAQFVVPGVAASAPPSVVVAAPAPTRPAAPPVDATGVVSRVDPQTGTIVLEDGRVLQATGRTTIWQPKRPWLRMR